jgi:hypothetical protein
MREVALVPLSNPKQLRTGVISRIDYSLLVIGENPEQQKDSDSSTPPKDSESKKSANL